MQDGPLRRAPPDTEERLRTVLVAGTTKCALDANFIPWFEQAIDGVHDRFAMVMNLAEDLAARLQPTRPASALPASLDGLGGDDLFNALAALRLSPAMAENTHLKVALAAQRLTQQESIDQVTRVYEQIARVGVHASSLLSYRPLVGA